MKEFYKITPLMSRNMGCVPILFGIKCA